MAEKDGIDELFKIADKSKDKKVSLKELDKIFDLLGLNLKFKDVKDIIKKYDDNNDKHLDKHEFRALITDFYKSEQYFNEAWEGFRGMDKNNDVFVSFMELEQVNGSMLGTKLADEDLKNLFATIDTSGNGMVEFEEFAKAYATGIAAGNFQPVE